MIGKVPNKANAPKKVLIRVIIVLLVWAVLLAFNLFNKLSDEGLRWTIPREVQDKVDFDKLEDNMGVSNCAVKGNQRERTAVRK